MGHSQTPQRCQTLLRYRSPADSNGTGTTSREDSFVGETLRGSLSRPHAPSWLETEERLLLVDLGQGRVQARSPHGDDHLPLLRRAADALDGVTQTSARSEERRVGKECRSR